MGPEKENGTGNCTAFAEVWRVGKTAGFCDGKYEGRRGVYEKLMMGEGYVKVRHKTSMLSVSPPFSAVDFFFFV